MDRMATVLSDALDEDLMDRAAAGDRAAYAEIEARYSGVLYRHFRYKIQDLDLARDLTQITLMKGWSGKHKWIASETNRFRAWILKTANNTLWDYLKQWNPAKPNGSDPGPITEAIRDDDISIEDTLVHRDVLQAFRHCFASLSTEEQSLCVLKYWEGADGETIRQRMFPDKSLSTSRHAAWLLLTKHIIPKLQRCLRNKGVEASASLPPLDTVDSEEGDAE